MSPTTRVMKSPKQQSRSAKRVARSSQTISRSTFNSEISTATSSSLSVRIATARKSSARRGRPLRGANTSTLLTPGHAPETEADRVDDSIQVNTHATPENERTHVQVVDLITPRPPIPVARAVRRPLEVDITCDLDDDVFVVLEVIVNRTRRTDLPIRSGTSPPQTSESKSSLISTTAQESSSRGIYCPLCLDSLSQVKEANHKMHSSTCGHIFCGPCITKVIAATKQCPTCHKDLNMSNVHPIFI